MINHQLVSVEEDFYDPFLRRELARMPTEFSQALLLGHTLGKYQLGISDALLAGRVEEWVRSGELEVLSPPAAGEIPDHLLRHMRHQKRRQKVKTE